MPNQKRVKKMMSIIFIILALLMIVSVCSQNKNISESEAIETEIVVSFRTNEGVDSLLDDANIEIIEFSELTFRALHIEITQFHEGFESFPEFYEQHIGEFSENGVIDEERLYDFLTENVGHHQPFLQGVLIGFTADAELHVGYRIGFDVNGEHKLYEIIGIVEDDYRTYIIVTQFNELPE